LTDAGANNPLEERARHENDVVHDAARGQSPRAARVREGDGMLATLETKRCTTCRRIVSVTTAATSVGRQHGATTIDPDRCPNCNDTALTAWSHHPDGNQQVGPCPACGEDARVRAVARWD
jgi:rubrerythrin